MPELPDILAYLTALEPRVVGQILQRVRVRSPFVVRTFDALDADLATFRAALSNENRSLKRALTDPATIDGIGNAQVAHRTNQETRRRTVA